MTVASAADRLVGRNFAAASDFIRLIRRNGALIWEFSRREISDRYAGQAFGVLWAIAHPMFLIGLYVFIFAFVFKGRIGAADTPQDYTTYILSGMIGWLGFQEPMIKACSVMTANASLVKQVVFPFEILPIKSVLASLPAQIVPLVLVLLYSQIRDPHQSWMYLMLPVLLVMQLLGMIGLAYLLSSIGAYFRDLKDFAQLFATAGVYLIPAFYMPDWVPRLVQPLLYVNPFSYPIWCFQDALYFGRFAHPEAWVMTALLSVTSFVVGYRVFRRLQPGFGSVL